MTTTNMAPVLTRRVFLIGTASAIAATALPPILMNQRTTFFTVPSQTRYSRRYISGLEAYFESDGKEDFAKITISRGEVTILEFAINTRSFLVWEAVPAGELIMLPKHVFQMGVVSRTGIGTIRLKCHDYYGDDPNCITVLEEHKFPGPSRPEIFLLDLNDEKRYQKYQATT